MRSQIRWFSSVVSILVLCFAQSASAAHTFTRKDITFKSAGLRRLVTSRPVNRAAAGFALRTAPHRITPMDPHRKPATRFVTTT